MQNEILSKISKKYVSNILPYELLLQILQLQTRKIQALQEQYKSFKPEIEKLDQELTPQQLNILKTHENHKILQRKAYIDEALSSNAKQYEKEYNMRKAELNEEIELKEAQIKAIRGQRRNIFVNFNEMFLDQFANYCKSKTEAITNSCQYWIKTYDNAKKDIGSSIQS